MTETESPGVRAVPLTRMRRAVAKAMTTSAAIPQFSVGRDVDLGRLVDLRPSLPDGVSTIDLLLAAIARTVARHPRLNSSWQDSFITEFDDVNLGLAIAVSDGLVVPAIVSAQEQTLLDLSRERRELTAQALQGRLTPVQLASATISVSNLGPTGVTSMIPMVIPPQAAIIGLPGRRRSGEMALVLSCDHRVIDGLPAAEFLRDLARAIEEPDWLLDIADTERAAATPIEVELSPMTRS